MRKKLSAILFLVFLIGTAAAMCPVVYTPPNSFVHITSDTQGLIAYDEDTETQRFVVRQAYEGVASDFGLVTPTPSEPDFTAKSDEIFKQLNDLTKKPVDRDRRGGGLIAAQSLSAEKEVRVVKEEKVGDFKATVLRANSSEALIDWLNRNGFDYGERSRENFQYYIDKGGYYFTALKVNVDNANCLTRREFQIGKNAQFRKRIPDLDEGYNGSGECWLRGGLKPLEFKFQSEKPVLPLRIMARNHDKSPMTPNSSLDGHKGHDHSHDTGGLPPGNFLLYTLSEQPLVVPGAKVKFSREMSSTSEPLSSYNVSGKFLVRQRVKFNAHEVEKDLYLKQAEPFYVSRQAETVINPGQTDRSNGIMEMQGTARTVKMQSSPGLTDHASYEVNRFMTDTGYTVKSTIENVSKGLAIFNLLIQVIVRYPLSLLLLLPPLALGILMHRKKSLIHASMMGYIGAALTPTVFLVALSGGFNFTAVLISVSIAVLPALLYGTVSFLTSTAASRTEWISDYRSELQGSKLLQSAGVYTAASLATGLTMYGLRQNLQESLTVPVLVWLVATGIGLYTIREKFTEETEVPKNERGDWKYLAIILFLLLVLTGGVSALMSLMMGPI
jgi:hypothetical protein